MEWFAVIAFGFLFTEKEAGSGLGKPWALPSWGRSLREGLDFFVTAAFLVTLGSLLFSVEQVPLWAKDSSILILGSVSYLLGRYQKKTDLFFLASTALSCYVLSDQREWGEALSLLGVLGAWIFVYQGFFFALKQKLFFLKIPPQMKGWPVTLLTGACLSLILWGFGSLIF